MILSPVSNFGDQSLYSMLSLWQFEKLSQSVPRDTTHMWYVNGAWLIISSAQFVLEHLYLIFHLIFPVPWKLSPLLERCCDILFKYAIVIWTTLTVRCRLFDHNKVHHPCCCCMVLQVIFGLNFTKPITNYGSQHKFIDQMFFLDWFFFFSFLKSSVVVIYGEGLLRLYNIYLPHPPLYP